MFRKKKIGEKASGGKSWGEGFGGKKLGRRLRGEKSWGEGFGGKKLGRRVRGATGYKHCPMHIQVVPSTQKSTIFTG